MSKLLEEYDEKQEAAASHEVIEVKVVAYTEHGVVVDLGGKTEGLIPAAEFTDTEIPRPEPNSTIEVQRTGEHKDGFTILSYLKVLRRRTWERIEAAFKAKETITGKVVDRIKGGVVVDIGVRAFLPGSQYDLRPAQNLDNLTGIVDVNGIQNDSYVKDILGTEPIVDKWRSFGWNVLDVDGHDVGAIADALDEATATKGRPTMIVCRTVKGKGVSFMENNPEYHGKAPNKDQLSQALVELEAARG